MGDVVNITSSEKVKRIKQAKIEGVVHLLSDCLSIVEMIHNGLFEGLPCEPLPGEKESYLLAPTGVLVFLMDESTVASVASGETTSAHIEAIRQYLSKLEGGDEMPGV